MSGPSASLQHHLIGSLVGVLMLASPGAHALNVALTNDDGWSSLGIQSVKTALLAAGHNVVLAGPLDEQSGSSAAINTSGLLIRKEQESAGALEFSVSVSGGTEGAEPATSALVAIDIARQQTGHLPDLVVSGINAGANIGSFTQVSGTVGAAIVSLSSTFNGAVPAIAISTDSVCSDASAECSQRNAEHYARVASFLTDLIADLERKPAFLRHVNGLLPAGLGLNINYPPVEVPVGVKVVQQGRTAAIGGSTLTLNLGCFVSCVTLPVGGSSPGGIKGTALDETPELRNADTTAYAQGYVTIVPIEGDYTADPVARLHAVIGLKSMFAKRGR